MDYYPQLRDTVLNALAPGTGAPAPIIGSNMGPELQKFYDINFQLPVSNAGVKALSAQTDTQVSNQQEAEKQRLQDLQDKLSGKGYQQYKKADGGFGFRDPSGREISAYEYANATGTTPSEVLKGSENPIDVGYLQDYNNLQDFLNAVINNDQESKDAFYAANPKLKKMKPQDVINQFKESYPTVYGRTNTGVPVGKTVIPNIQSLLNNAAYVGASNTVGG